MKHPFSSTLLVALGVWAVLQFAPSVAQAANCTSGSLIKGSGPAVYYCGTDGKRYVFPNIFVYNSWYKDFSGVLKLSDATIATIQIGGNVTYRPGVRLVKLATNPRVYAIDAGGVLRAIASESVAQQLYGAAWNRMIDDMPDTFFADYRLGADIASSSQFAPASSTSTAASINADKKLSGGTASGGRSVTLSLSPDVTTLTSAQTMTVSVTVSDPAGVTGVSLFLKGNLLKYCGQSPSPETATCSATVTGGDYADGSILAIYGQEVNRNGERHISETKNVTVSGGSSGVVGSVSMTYSPNLTTLNAGQSTTVSVTAIDPVGLSSVSVFVNGAVAQNCQQNGISTTATCTTTLYGANYPSGSSVAVYGQGVNKNGVPTLSATTTFTVQVGSSASGGSATLTFTPSATTLAIGDTMTVHVSAYAPIGVSTLALYVNGARLQSCEASVAHNRASCNVDLNGSNYASGANVALYARASDADGNVFVSPTTNLTITAGIASNNVVSLSFSPYATSLAPGQTTTVTATANDTYRVTAIRVYVNDVLARTCTLAGTSTTGTCSVTLSGSNYASGSTISVYGRDDNANGITNTSATSTLSVSSAAASNGTVSLFVSPSVTSLTGSQTATVTVMAYDPAGLGSVNVLVNGTNMRSCSQSGTWPTGASCTYVIAAANYTSGTTISLRGQGVSTGGTSTYSTTSSLAIN